MIPETVKVGAMTYPVTVCQIVNDEFPGRRGECWMGHEIRIKADLPPDSANLTLWHEIMHAIQDIAETATDEPVATLFASAVLGNQHVNWRDGPVPPTVNVLGLSYTPRVIPEEFAPSISVNSDRCEIIFADGNITAAMARLCKGLLKAWATAGAVKDDPATARLGAYLYQVLIDNPALWESQKQAERPSATKRGRRRPVPNKAA